MTRPVPTASLSEVAREWGRIGVIGFGGPPAHVALHAWWQWVVLGVAAVVVLGARVAPIWVLLGGAAVGLIDAI